MIIQKPSLIVISKDFIRHCIRDHEKPTKTWPSTLTYRKGKESINQISGQDAHDCRDLQLFWEILPLGLMLKFGKMCKRKPLLKEDIAGDGAHVEHLLS